MVRSGGVLAAPPALVREGLPGTAARHLRLPNGCCGLAPVLPCLAFLFLARVRNPERMRHQTPGEWGLIPGLDRAPEAKTLRRKIRAIAAKEEAVRDWMRSLTAKWTAGAKDAVLAVDGRARCAADARATCRRGSCRPEALPGTSSSCWINALDGAPLLFVHRRPDPGLAKSVRSEIVPALEETGVLPTDAPDRRRRMAGNRR